MRIGWSLAAGALAVAVLVARIGPPSSPTTTAPPTIASASVPSDGTELVLDDDAGATIRRYPLTAWRRWVVSGGLPESIWPIRLGEETLSVDAFDRFEVAARRPGGRQAFFVASAYAMLTTVSVPVLLGPSGDPEPFGPSVLGDVETPIWSPDGELLAFTVGTARGRGVALEVRDGSSGAVALDVDAERLLGAWREANGVAGEDAGDAPSILPNVRELSWSGPDELAFVSDDPAGSDGSVSWTATPQEGTLAPDLDASDDGAGLPSSDARSVLAAISDR